MNTKKITKAKKMSYIRKMAEKDEEFLFFKEKIGLTFEHVTITDLTTKKNLQAGNENLGYAGIFLNQAGYVESYFCLKMDRKLQTEYKKKFKKQPQVY